MRINPITFGITQHEKVNSFKSLDFVPTTVRHNSLSDMDFNIIADTIRCQNLKNQMNVRLMNLKRNLDNCMAKDFYKRECI